MGNQLVWQERFNLGVDLIDKEHKKLFSILNRLLADREKDEKSQWVYQEGIKYFKEHAMKHFAEEEVYMASISYPGFEMHRRIHDNFRKQTLPALEKELNQTDYAPEAVEHFLGVCSGWLIGHTLTEDRAIVGKTASKWNNLLSEEEQANMGQVILQLIDDLFQLEAQVISECYGGEKFGKGIYYRLVYESDQGKKWENILIFEERLILNTVGGLLGVKSRQVDAMMVTAARYTAKQFVERIKAYMPGSEIYELRTESLLSYEQFHREFELENPQYSLLFDTGEGYFAYCVMAPHLLQNDGIVSIKAENAMSEVERYLSKNQGSKKKKILIVDDSDLMREALKELLEKDYELSMADSGIAAIRSITLNRPDLVILDYEMPVCDGTQVLGMIRAEKDFEDIPVIFLTGRMDKESVHKAVSLKPSGYLLKTLKPEKIKKEIDDYFRKKVS